VDFPSCPWGIPTFQISLKSGGSGAASIGHAPFDDAPDSAEGGNSGKPGLLSVVRLKNSPFGINFERAVSFLDISMIPAKTRGHRPRLQHELPDRVYNIPADLACFNDRPCLALRAN
jgi:hypothetical protein